ncbi:MAG: lactonase family protein [Balneolaceae bacterium]
MIRVTAFITFLGMLAAGTAGCTEESASEEPASKEYIYVGTFADRGSEGLYVFEFNRESGELNQVQTVSDRESPSFQYMHPEGHVLYSASREDFSEEVNYGTLGAYSIDRENGRLTLINEQSVEGRGPAHVSVDPLGRFVYVSNYGTGNLSVFGIEDNGGIGEAVDVVQHEGSSVNENRQESPHVHSIIPSADGRFIYASDLGTDRINIYEPDPSTGILDPADSPYFENTPGAGPRHFAFHPDGEFAYSAEELTSTVAVLNVDRSTGALEQVQRVEMLPEGFDAENSAADIHVSPDGRHLYASNRGHDSLVIYSIDENTGELSLIGHESTRGGHPRNFMIDSRGEFVLVANRDDDNVVVFRRDDSSGMLTYTGFEAHVPMAVCLTQLIVE